MTTPATPKVPLLPANTGQQPAPPSPGGPVPPGGIGFTPNLRTDRLFLLFHYYYFQNDGYSSAYSGDPQFNQMLNYTDAVQTVLFPDTLFFVGELPLPGIIDDSNQTLSGYAYRSPRGPIFGSGQPPFGQGLFGGPLNDPVSLALYLAFFPLGVPGRTNPMGNPFYFGLHNMTGVLGDSSGYNNGSDILELTWDLLTIHVPAYVGRDAGIATGYYPLLAAWAVGLLFSTVYEGPRTTLVTTFNSTATAINNNPALQNPLGTVTTEVAKLQAMVDAQRKAVEAIVGGVLLAVGGAVTQVTGIAGSTVTTVTALVDTQVKFALATLASTQAQVDAAVTNARAVVAQQQAIIEAEVKKQGDAATAVVTKAIADAGTAAGQAVATLTGVVAGVTTELGRVAGELIVTGGTIVASLQAQAADRPLYYGALSTPVTIGATTDVVVIPPGGLVITAE